MGIAGRHHGNVWLGFGIVRTDQRQLDANAGPAGERAHQSREVGGVAYVNVRGRPLFGWHAWAEIHDGTQWVTVDPTWDQLNVDATHIATGQKVALKILEAGARSAQVLVADLVDGLR